MRKPKSNLSLHRPRKRNNQLKATKSLWRNTEDEVFGCLSAQYIKFFASNIKSPRTLKEPKVKTFTPSKKTVTLKSPSPKKYVHSLKRMFIKLPRTKFHDTTCNKHIEKKTTFKSPSTNKVRKSLTQDSSRFFLQPSVGSYVSSVCAERGLILVSPIANRQCETQINLKIWHEIKVLMTF